MFKKSKAQELSQFARSKVNFIAITQSREEEKFSTPLKSK